MANNPGYVLVDFTGVDVGSNDSVTIKGINKRVRDAFATGKPCYVCNLVKGNNPLSPMPVTVYQTAQEVVVKGPYNLSVSTRDVVTLS